MERTAETTPDRLHTIVAGLIASGEFADAKVVETHISVVVLAGEYVYKFKKAVDLGFLDFSTLALRRFNCEEELRLNRRLAPRYYLDVVPVTGSGEAPRLGGSGPAIEYCVRMRRFPAGQQFDERVRAGTLTAAHVQELAQRVAAFHASTPRAEAAMGTPGEVIAPARHNLDALEGASGLAADLREDLKTLRAWTEAAAVRLHAVFLARHDDGAIRECHGDMHLANITLDGSEIVIFDCIEFSPSLRCIDVMSEVAFVCIDLDYHRRADLANLFLNTYLEHTGDYAGAAVLRYYEIYRALVRAKVAAIRADQPGIDAAEQQAQRARCRDYIRLAVSYLPAAAPSLIVTHGLSGSGKSRVSAALAPRIRAIRLRSDIERKRLHGLAMLARSDSTVTGGIYTKDASARTYAHLRDLAESVLRAGYSVIVDAAFLQQGQRREFAALAARLGVRFRILSVRANEEELRRRLHARQAGGADPSEADTAVLEYQLATQEPLQESELPQAWVVDTTAASPEETAERLAAHP
jgi:aminoglycoside phosphotransferase family enzyme/gluconate kinase